MMPSEILREIISKKIKIDLAQYAWCDDLKNFIFNIELDKMYEENVSTMKEVFECGFNIGHCGLTSRYLVRNLEDADLYYGKFSALKGTKRAENGGHAWVVKDNILIDTTLMIMLPVKTAKELGYKFEKVIAKSSAKILSEYELYSHEYKHYIDDYSNYSMGLYTLFI